MQPEMHLSVKTAGTRAGGRRTRPRAWRTRTRAWGSWLAALAAFIVLAGSPGPAPAAPAAPRVQVELVSEAGAIRAGETFWVGLHQRIAPGWHTYWVNPGDSGEPARIEWSLPDGFAAAEVVWPHPGRIPVGPVMSYGYSDEVTLPIAITAPAGLGPGERVTLRGQASWLVCEKECIPEEAPVALTLPVTAGAPPPDARGAALIGEARRAVPSPSPWPASFAATPETVRLTIGARELVAERVADAWFYPLQWGAIDHAAPQRRRVDARGLTLEVARGQLPDAVAAPIDGVLVLAERLEGGMVRHAFSVRAVPAGAPGAPAGAAAPSAGRVTALDGIAGVHPAVTPLQAGLLALLGGLVLNLMPCVLPILSVKALGLVRHAAGSAAALRWHGLAYTAGVMASFAVVAGVLLALRAAGEQVGWGFQLQSPVAVTLLAHVFFAMGLVLSGVLVVTGGRLAGIGHGLAARSGYAGSFCTGALATVAATPCTAPFMGVAVGFALTQPWSTALLVFQALALGLALPYLLLTLVPSWRRLLPAPGPWMDRLKQVLAFPLYASAAWLVWVVSQQAGPPGVAAALAGLVLIGFAAWLIHASRHAGPRWRRAATVAGAASVVVAALGPVAAHRAGSWPAAPDRARDAEAFAPARLAALRASGKPVFVNVTAAWCITCLVNERVALRSPAVADAFARKGVVVLKADWTSRDPVITGMLESFGRSGVPLYLLYPPGAGGPAPGEPAVLPQILTEGIVIEAVEKI
jgi:thiol:disulfide interchange protein DsbD